MKDMPVPHTKSAAAPTGFQPAYEATAALLVDLGVHDVFGLMGDDTVRLVSALVDRGVRYHDARHENAAVAMAAGYASTTGALGVCVISRGPGTTNALTALANAARGDATPVLAITGDEWVHPPANSVLLPDGKALDIAVVGAGCGFPTFTPQTARSLPHAVLDAAGAAMRGHTVLLTIPRDLFEAPVELPASTATGPGPSPAPLPARQQSIDAAVAMISRSRRPMIVAGAGAWSAGATSALVELADRIGAVLSTSLRGIGMFAGHPLNAGLIGSWSHTAGRRLMDEADCVLTFGASLNLKSTSDGSGLPTAPVVHVDSDRASIGRFYWADVAVVGDARVVCEQLLAALPERSPEDKPLHSAENIELLARFDPAADFEAASTRWAIDPRTLILELDRLLPDDRAVVTDNGNFFGFIPPHMRVPSPDRFKLSSDFSTIGLGFGTAMGATIARPDTCTVLFIGDGAMLMSLGELETLARLDLPLIVVIMNDAAYGAERHFLELRGFSGKQAMFPDTDFAALAEAFALEAATVRTVADLEALAPLLATGRVGPLVLDCKVSPDVVAGFLSGHVAGR
ncbi:MAG: thiamine pyrophosphate-binding protein [Mycobacteriales bacterium]